MAKAKKKATRAGRGKVAKAVEGWALTQTTEIGGKPLPRPILLPTSVFYSRKGARENCAPWNGVVRVRITPIPPKRRAAR